MKLLIMQAISLFWPLFWKSLLRLRLGCVGWFMAANVSKEHTASVLNLITLNLCYSLYIVYINDTISHTFKICDIIPRKLIYAIRWWFRQYRETCDFST
jgi:hypothetical protein